MTLPEIRQENSDPQGFDGPQAQQWTQQISAKSLPAPQCHGMLRGVGTRDLACTGSANFALR